MRKIKVILMSVFLALFIAGCSSGTSAEFFESGSQISGKTEQSDSGMEVHFIDVGPVSYTHLCNGRRFI